MLKLSRATTKILDLWDWGKMGLILGLLHAKDKKGVKQCDQIWRNFATFAKHIKTLAKFWGFIKYSIWQNFEPTLANVLCKCTNFHCCKWPNNPTIWSHWSHVWQGRKILRTRRQEPYSIKLNGSVNYRFVKTAKFWSKICTQVGKNFIQTFINCYIMVLPVHFFVYFCLFKQKLRLLQQKMWKMPI